jgi:hypothetical protein
MTTRGPFHALADIQAGTETLLSTEDEVSWMGSRTDLDTKLYPCRVQNSGRPARQPVTIRPNP